MNNDFDQIEKMLAERLRSIDPPGASADTAWEALSSNLPAPKRKRKFFFLFWSLLFISATSTAVYLYYHQTANGEQLTANGLQLTANSEQQSANSEQQTADSLQLTANSEQQSANSEQLTANSEQRTANGEQQTVDGLQRTANGLQRTANGLQRTADSEQLTANSEQQSANGEQRTVDGLQLTANSEQQSANGEQLTADSIQNEKQNENENEVSQELRTKNQEQIANSEQLTADSIQNEKQNENEVSQEPSLDTLASQALGNQNKEPIANNQEPIADSQEPSLDTLASQALGNQNKEPIWSIKAVMGYNLLSPKDADLADYYPLVGNYIQVSGRYNWSKTYAEAGIQHATWKYGIDYFKTTSDKVLIEDTLLSMVVNAQTGAIISQVYGDTLVNRTITRRVRYNNTFSTIQVPLEFGYYLNKNKWQFEAGLGINLIYVYKQSGRYLTTDSDITDIISTNNLGVKQFVIQPQLSFGTSYMLDPKWTVGLEAGAGLIPSSWVPSGINKSMFPINVGISVVKKF
jgi:hypothetical protein